MVLYTFISCVKIQSVFWSKTYYTVCFIINWPNLYKRINNTERIIILLWQISRFPSISEIHGHFWTKFEWVWSVFQNISCSGDFWLNINIFWCFFIKGEDVRKKTQKGRQTCKVSDFFFANLNSIFWWTHFQENFREQFFP